MTSWTNPANDLSQTQRTPLADRVGPRHRARPGHEMAGASEAGSVHAARGDSARAELDAGVQHRRGVLLPCWRRWLAGMAVRRTGGDRVHRAGRLAGAHAA